MRLSRGEAILERQLGARHGERFGKELLGHVRRGVAHQRLAREQNSARGSRRSASARQCSKVASECTPAGDALGIERGDRLVVDQDVLPPRLVLELGDLGDELPVVRGERALRRQLARDERLADEYVPRGLRIDVAVRDAPPRHQRQPVELDALAGDDLAAVGIPARLEVVARHAIAGDGLDPFGLDLRRAARVEPRCFHELGGEHPFRPLLREARSRVQMEPDSARAPRSPSSSPSRRADVAEQAREQRLVDRLVRRRVDGSGQLRLPRPALLGDFAGELRVHVAPFAQAQVGNELRAAGIDELAVRELLAELLLEELPEREQRQEIGALVAEQEVRLVGRLLLRERPIARIGNGQRARDDEHFGDAAAVARRERPSDRCADRPAAARASRPSGVRRRSPSTAPSSCSSW